MHDRTIHCRRQPVLVVNTLFDPVSYHPPYPTTQNILPLTSFFGALIDIQQRAYYWLVSPPEYETFLWFTEVFYCFDNCAKSPE
jgi:hypothetical protein